MTVTEYEEYLTLIEEGKELEAELLREKDIPDVLIKHIWLDETDEDNKKFYTLENESLWISSVEKFNDPYEFKGLILDKNKFTDSGYPEKTIEKFQALLDMREYGVSCLSARDVNYLPMWAYYTNNYKGFCVEYELINKSAIHQVMYEPNRTPIASLFFQLQKELVHDANGGIFATSKGEKIGRLLMLILYMKSKNWEHEKEYRIIYPLTETNGQNVKLKDVGLKVKRIITGINCSEKNIDRLNEISNNIGCGNIYQTRLSETQYGMEIIRK